MGGTLDVELTDPFELEHVEARLLLGPLGSDAAHARACTIAWTDGWNAWANG